MTPLRPERMLGLPRDQRGYPVPWFVEWIDGAPDFRVTSRERMAKAVRLGLYAVGIAVGLLIAFVLNVIGDEREW